MRKLVFRLFPAGIQRNPRTTRDGPAEHHASPAVGMSQHTDQWRIGGHTFQQDRDSRPYETPCKEHECRRVRTEKVHRLVEFIDPQ